MGKDSQVGTTLYNNNNNGVDEANDVMGRLGWLSQTPKEFRKTVLHRCRLLNFQKGEPIYQLNDPPGGLYGLVSGAVRVSLAPQERGPYIAHIMHPGNWYGLAAAVGRQPRTIALTAARQSQLLLLPMTELEKIVATDPGAWRHFLALAIMNSNIAISAVDDLLIRSPPKRCVAVLLRLSGLRNASQDRILPCEVEIRQEELAHLSNLSRNATGTILRSLAKRGLLELDYRHIRIFDPQALRTILQEDSDV